ncbi:ROK family transcriptional regulator [Agromyces atrinae]|uniref:ROK family transcriptional regulator n=1 Tax=Agromyces atrinae TaxID=592376 RepID=UPI001F5685F5|nr:ROK family transcriptional regulator [Agromyces atrinae]MCI2957904.1 ROK family transcriptional regulator [Agromyces atrinae]
MTATDTPRSTSAATVRAGVSERPSASLFARGRALRPSGKVLPEHARTHNRALVLQTLYGAGPLSRADIARQTGLTRVTVSELVAELMTERLVIDRGQREGVRPGKPATLLDVDRGSFHVISVDLSETGIVRGAVHDLDDGILARAQHTTGPTTGDALVDEVLTLVGEMLDLATAPVLGIGVGSPGVVDRAGVVLSAPNLGWTDLPLQRLIADRFRVPVHVANDANVAVLAEHAAQHTSSDLLLVRVGLGVGAGLIIAGHPVVGGAFAAGEIGHVVVGTDEGPLCACGRHGCLEAWLAAPRLAAEIDRLASSVGIDRARDEVLREAGRRLGIVLAPVVGALNLSDVVVSGPTELLAGAFLDATIETLRQRTMADFNRDLTLRMTSHGQDIVLRGAAVMVLSGQLGVS